MNLQPQQTLQTGDRTAAQEGQSHTAESSRHPRSSSAIHMAVQVNHSSAHPNTKSNQIIAYKLKMPKYR